MMKRMGSLLLAALMLCSVLLPVAYAAEETQPSENTDMIEISGEVGEIEEEGIFGDPEGGEISDPGPGMQAEIQPAEEMASAEAIGNAAIDLVWPCATAYRISALYYYKDGSVHSCSYGKDSGIDITGGGNIVAVANGTVEVVADKGTASYGKYIVIRHENGMRSLYAHLSSFGTVQDSTVEGGKRQIRVGDEVTQSQVIGVMGSTGNSSATHLHFEYEGADPFRIFYKDKYKSKVTFAYGVRTNNKKYNSNQWIVEWIDKYYKHDSDYADYYYNPQCPEKPHTIVNTVSGVHIYWYAMDGISKYGVWRSETGVDGTYEWLGNPAAIHFTDTKVTSGKTYYYRITAMDPTTGEHSDKSEAIGIAYVATPDITGRVNKAAGISLTWNKITGATGYAIYRKPYSGGAWVRVATISGNSTFTWLDSEVKDNNGTVYKYTVRALAGSDMKTLSGCRAAGRTMARLTSRTLSAADRKSFTSIQCKWSTTSKASGYEVRFMVGSSVYKTFTVGNYATGTKTFAGLKSGQNYKVQVRSYKKVDAVGTFYSAWSEPKYVTLLSYELFLKNEGYLDDWDGWYDPAEYTLLDIDQDGDDELIIISDTSDGFYCFLVYRMTALGTIELVDCYYDGSEDYGTVDSCWAGLRYSSKYKSLVFSETRNGIMYGGLTYWHMEKDTLKGFAGISYEVDMNTNVTYYYSSLDGSSRKVSQSTYNAYINELVWLEYEPLP